MLLTCWYQSWHATVVRKHTSARNYRPCFRENQPKRSFSIKWKRAFWARFRENWVYKFGHSNWRPKTQQLCFRCLSNISATRSQWRNPHPQKRRVYDYFYQCCRSVIFLLYPDARIRNPELPTCHRVGSKTRWSFTAGHLDAVTRHLIAWYALKYKELVLYIFKTLFGCISARVCWYRHSPKQYMYTVYVR